MGRNQGRGSRGRDRSQRKGRGRGNERKSSASDEIVIYGVHPVEEYLTTGADRVQRLMMASGREPLEKVAELASEARLTIEVVSSDVLDELSDGRNHQGVMIVGQPYRYASLGELIQGVGEKREAMILVLDQIQDAGNLGAILRSAAAFGVDGVVISKDRAASVTAAVVRTSAGQALRVKVASETNLSRALDELKEAGFWAVGTQVEEGQQATPPWEIDCVGTRVALVLGGEHGGVRRLVAQRCDFVAHVPMAPGVESLNVGAAASVLMYEVRRQWRMSAEAE